MADPLTQASWNTDQALIFVASEGRDLQLIEEAGDPRPPMTARQGEGLTWLLYTLEQGQRAQIEDRLLGYLWSGQLRVRDDGGLIEPAWFDGASIQTDRQLRTFFRRVARDPTDRKEHSDGTRLLSYDIEERRPRFNPRGLQDLLLASTQASPGAYRTGMPGKPSSIPLVESELRRRAAQGALEPTITRQAVVLEKWLEETHPNAPRLKSKGIKNKLSELYRRLRDAQN